MTDDGTLFIPAPDGYSRKEQMYSTYMEFIHKSYIII